MIAHGKLPYLRLSVVLLFYLVFSLPPVYRILKYFYDPDQALDTGSSNQQAKKIRTLISMVPYCSVGV